jgi:hypothetical protein
VQDLETNLEFLPRPYQRGSGSLAPAKTGENGAVFHWR